MQSNRQYIPEGLALTLSLGEGLRQSAAKSAAKGPKRGQCERRERLHMALQAGGQGFESPQNARRSDVLQTARSPMGD